MMVEIGEASCIRDIRMDNGLYNPHILRLSRMLHVSSLLPSHFTHPNVCIYRALIIGRLALSDPTFISYPDIARKAWGPRSVLFVRIFVCVVLFSYWYVSPFF